MLATRLREQHTITLQRGLLCLGRLESSDFVPLSAVRKDAVLADKDNAISGAKA